jgi:hypothetical protein
MKRQKQPCLKQTIPAFTCEIATVVRQPPAHPRSSPQRPTTHVTYFDNVLKQQNSWMPNPQRPTPSLTRSSTCDPKSRVPVRGLHPMSTATVAGLSGAFWADVGAANTASWSGNRIDWGSAWATKFLTRLKGGPCQLAVMMILAPVHADLVSVGGIAGISILESHICCPRVGYLIEFRRFISHRGRMGCGSACCIFRRLVRIGG